MKARTASLVAATLSLLAPFVAAGARQAIGEWGGTGIAVTVRKEGSTIEFDCGHGRIEGGIELDAQGHFDLAGTFTPEGGPTRAGEETKIPVRYAGTVKGNAMTLKMTAPDM